MRGRNVLGSDFQPIPRHIPSISGAAVVPTAVAVVDITVTGVASGVIVSAAVVIVVLPVQDV